MTNDTITGMIRSQIERLPEDPSKVRFEIGIVRCCSGPGFVMPPLRPGQYVQVFGNYLDRDFHVNGIDFLREYVAIHADGRQMATGEFKQEYQRITFVPAPRCVFPKELETAELVLLRFSNGDVWEVAPARGTHTESDGHWDFVLKDPAFDGRGSASVAALWSEGGTQRTGPFQRQ